MKIAVEQVGEDTAHVHIGNTVLKLDAKGVDNFIRVLAEVRQHLAPPHPEDPVGQDVMVQPDPKYYVEARPDLDALLLAYRDGRLGWQALQFPRQEVPRLQELILEHAALLARPVQ